MNEEPKETQRPMREESHPWMTLTAASVKKQSEDEVIQDTLDELRFA